MKKILCFLPLFLALCGCGYTLGSIAHPQLESVAVAEAVNESVEPNLSYFIRQNLAEQFQTDGSLKLLGKSEADCIVYPRIIRTNYGTIAAASTNNDISFVGRLYSMSVTVEYTVIIPGRVSPIKRGTVTGEGRYEIMWDPEVHKQAALNAACREAAQKIVQNLVEGW